MSHVADVSTLISPKAAAVVASLWLGPNLRAARSDRCCDRGAAGAAVAGADGHCDRRGRTARRGLLRCGTQPCARVMAAGHGGQILLAESTASLLSGAGGRVTAGQ